MSREEREVPAKEPDAQEDPDPLTVVLARLETINLSLFQIDQRLQEVEKIPDSKELDSRRASLDAPIISQSSVNPGWFAHFSS